MPEVYPSFFDRERYSLSHPIHGSLVIDMPEGWRNDDKEFARVKNYAGIVTKFSNNLKFIGNGAAYIETVKKTYGINAEIFLKNEIRNPETDDWEEGYSGVLDLSTYTKEDRKVSVKFNSSGLEQLLKSREKENVEIDRTKTIDGKEIESITFENLLLPGRRVFLKSSFDVSGTNNQADINVASNVGDPVNKTVGYPLRIKTNSHQGLIASVTPQINGSTSVGDLGMMFLFDSDRDRVIDLDIRGKTNLIIDQYEDVQWAYYRICLTVYKNGFDFDLKNRIILTTLVDPSGIFGSELNGSVSPYTIPNIEFSYQNSSFELLEGESLAVEGWLDADLFNSNNAGIRVFARDIVGTFDSSPGVEPEILRLNEDSEYPSTYTKTILAHEMGEKLVEIITGSKDDFRSKALGRASFGYMEDGPGAYLGFSHGFWIRQFDKEPQNDENKFKPLTISFRDWVEFLKTSMNLDVGIEPIGSKERIVVESLDYFFNQNVTIKLPFQVNNVKRTVAKDYYYSGIEIGYEKGGEYEEAMGLDEYNAKSTFTTAITRIENIFRMVSKIRTDMYGCEFARRKPITDFPTEDSPYDQDVFAFDMKPGMDEYNLRTWEDDFAQLPQNVFSPETAANLRFSPFNIMFYKHGWNIASALIEYPLEFVRYGSSTANSKLRTQIIGGTAYSENEEEVRNDTFNKARFYPEWIEFEHVVDHDMMKQIQGNSVILGQQVRNFYGLIEFINEDGERERGFLFNLKPNGPGKWKLLKHNR